MSLRIVSWPSLNVRGRGGWWWTISPPWSARSARAATRGAWRVDEYLAALVATLLGHGVTALCIDEGSVAARDRRDDLAGPLSALADNVLVLRRSGAPPRQTLAVVKMRFSTHDAGAHEFVIAAPGGIHLRRSFPDGGAEMP